MDENTLVNGASLRNEERIEWKIRKLVFADDIVSIIKTEEMLKVFFNDLIGFWYDVSGNYFGVVMSEDVEKEGAKKQMLQEKGKRGLH